MANESLPDKYQLACGVEQMAGVRAGNEQEMAELAHDDRQSDPFLANESKVQALLERQTEEQERLEMAVMDGQQSKARDINFVLRGRGDSWAARVVRAQST